MNFEANRRYGNVFDSLGNHYLLFIYSFMTQPSSCFQSWHSTFDESQRNYVNSPAVLGWILRHSNEILIRVFIKAEVANDPLGLREKRFFQFIEKTIDLKRSRPFINIFPPALWGKMGEAGGTSMFFNKIECSWRFVKFQSLAGT